MNLEEFKGSSYSVKKKAKLSNWISSSFESFPTSQEHDNPTKKRKFLKHTSIELPKPDNNATWLQRYAPRTVDQLAVHKKKVTEVESWLTQDVGSKKGGAPILLLTGPSGSGKTSTLLLVARKHGIHVEEWSNPLTTPFSITKEAGLKYESQITTFEDFLFRSGKYTSVLLNKEDEDHPVSKKLILLEEFPNFIYQDPSCICDLLRRYHTTQRWPLVLIISNGATSDPLKKHLREFRSSIMTIIFNPVSATLMTKALNRISLSENRSLSKKESSIMSSTGDIRAAINSLQFSSQFETLKEVAQKKRISQKSKSTEPVGGKDTTLILFRALGKIFYCKRQKPAQESSIRKNETYRDPLLVQPEDILDQCCLSGSAFSLFLHHNYLAFNDNNPIEDITTASDYLSLSDMMNSPLTSSDPSSGALTHLDRYEGVLASRGLIYANSKRATSDSCASSSGTWRPIHKPTWYEVKRKEQENRINSHRLFWKQEDALPCLVHLASKFDPPQRNFLREVVALPNWKSFRSHDDRLSDQIGDDVSDNTDVRATGGDVISKSECAEDEDDVTIEEFSD